MSTGVDVYSTTPASNGTLGGTGYFPEGQAPSTVNDAARQVMADIAAWYGQAKIPEYLTGTAGTNTITAGGPSALAAYAPGQRFTFLPANTNTGAATINITPSGGAALGAKNIFNAGVALVAGEIKAAVPCEILYDGTQFNLLSNGVNGAPGSSQTFITGAVSLNNTANYFNVCNTGSIGAAGQMWLLVGVVTVTDTVGAANINARIWDTSTVFAETSCTVQASNSEMVMTVLALVSPSAATTYHLSCKDLTSTSGQALQTGNAGTANKATSITAIRLI